MLSKAEKWLSAIFLRICDWDQPSCCNDKPVPSAYSKLLTQILLEETVRFMYLHSVDAHLIACSELHCNYAHAPKSNFAGSFLKQ